MAGGIGRTLRIAACTANLRQNAWQGLATLTDEPGRACQGVLAAQLLIGQLQLEHAVHHQIGIAADRTRKVAVARSGKRKVALVARLVQCALHAAQQQHVDKRRVGRASRGVDRSLQLIGTSQGNTSRTAVVDDAQLRQRHGGAVQAIGTGIIVHAIASLNVAVGQPLGHALVGQQHGFLDKRRGTRTLARHDLHGHSVLIQ